MLTTQNDLALTQSVCKSEQNYMYMLLFKYNLYSEQIVRFGVHCVRRLMKIFLVFEAAELIVFTDFLLYAPSKNIYY